MIKEFWLPKDNPEDIFLSLNMKSPEDYEIWNYPLLKVVINNWERISNQNKKSIQDRFSKLGYMEKPQHE